MWLLSATKENYFWEIVRPPPHRKKQKHYCERIVRSYKKEICSKCNVYAHIRECF